ncbi:hypothetical protein TNIN_309411 [Trichonephila inaurata madagascariensis]|uniref:Uncharacterized protein n=1 Tax=Trichonephila inaurata madagascariensis TaxID=2747483 RepID=A0A8X6WPC3_9ARAC|nr:hypothetical protein TNIN_309411 [Trichonephila inaurata madagascariensis]
MTSVTSKMNSKVILMVTAAFLWSCSKALEARHHRETWWKDTKIPETSNESIKKAIEFMLEAEKNFIRFGQASSRAHWDWSVNITEENRKVKVS